MTIEKDEVVLTFSFDPFFYFFANNKFFNVVHQALSLTTGTDTSIWNTEYSLTKSANVIMESLKGYALIKNFDYFHNITFKDSPFTYILKENYGNLEIKNLKFSSLINADKTILICYIINLGKFSDFYIENLYNQFRPNFIQIGIFEKVIISNFTITTSAFDIDVAESESNNDKSYHVWKFSEGKELEVNNVYLD